MLPDLDDLLATVRVVTLDLRRRFRGITEREIAVFEGPHGWSEFSPFLEYGDHEASQWLRAGIAFAWNAVPALHRSSITVNATVPAIHPDDVPAVLAEYPGTLTAKVKVAEPGQSLDDDVARVHAVRECLGPQGRIRIDANGLWTVAEAARAFAALAPFNIEYVEQPCATVGELEVLRHLSNHPIIPIAADESIRKATDPLLVARSGAADLLVVKAQPLGGLHAALEIVHAAGLPVVVSSALDSSIGISMGAHLAAALPRLEHACGLGTASMFVHDIVDSPLTPHLGAIPVERLVPNPRLLDALEAPPERTFWWHERIRRCYALLCATDTNVPER